MKLIDVNATNKKKKSCDAVRHDEDEVPLVSSRRRKRPLEVMLGEANVESNNKRDFPYRWCLLISCLVVVPLLISCIVRKNGAVTLMPKSLDTSLRLQTQLCAGNGLPCPRLFLVVEADRPASIWRHPREWARNQKSVKLELYFVCSHSLEPVSDKCRIKLRYTHDWLKKIAPAYNMSLFAIKTAASVYGMELPLEVARWNELDEWVNGLLDPQDREVLTRAHEKALENDGSFEDSDVQTLIGQAYSLVAEKASAGKDNLAWHDELVEAFDFHQKQATFIRPRYQHLPRYNTWQAL